MHARLAAGLAALAGALAAQAPQQPSSDDLESQRLRELLSIRRVYVDRLTGGEVAAHIREMIVAALHSAKLFVVTENPERADAILRGSAEDLVYTDTFASSEGLSVRGSFGTGTSRTSTSQGSRTYGSIGVGEHSSTRIAERRHEASAAVRLVNRHGDVIWATTQESTGGKFRGASADVADKITRQLVADYERARRIGGVGPPSAESAPPSGPNIASPKN
ncbi:MAG: hypothetical protein RMI94_08250 [Bryobacterales bacterium]|nr:hypothetical protein [Bryobacteraceae bacterium]MDW8130526.1 hypothetical protein [Bryobacterales bacterium]